MISKALFLPCSHLLLRVARDMDIFIYTLWIYKQRFKGLAQSHIGAHGPGLVLNYHSKSKTDYADARGGAQGSETGGLGPKPSITDRPCDCPRVVTELLNASVSSSVESEQELPDPHKW